MSYVPQISRRSVLKGALASLTLPFLPSLAWAGGQRDPALPPRRFVAMGFGNGVFERDWWAKGAGDAMQLGPTLAPLLPFRRQLTVLDNLHQDARLAMRHGYYFTAFLSGGVPEKGAIRSAVSLDQLLAQELGGMTPIPSMVLGIEPTRTGIVNSAFSIYHSSMSWAGEQTPVPPETLPQQAFDRLFDTTSLRADKSVLDFVLADTRSLNGTLSVADQAKLDEYLTSVRELEQRVSRAANDARPAGAWRPSLEAPDLERPGEERLPVPQHLELMMDILVLALRMDKTRFATFTLHQDFSNLTFEFIDGVYKEGIHTISHHQNQQKAIEAYTRINRWHSEQLARFLGKLQAVDEGHGTTLLDNTLTLYGSSMMDGNSHDVSKVPLLLAGGGSCGIRTGRVLRLEDDAERRLCNCHLSIARAMGLDLGRFGNSSGELKGLVG